MVASPLFSQSRVISSLLSAAIGKASSDLRYCYRLRETTLSNIRADATLSLWKRASGTMGWPHYCGVQTWLAAGKYCGINFFFIILN